MKERLIWDLKAHRVARARPWPGTRRLEGALRLLSRIKTGLPWSLAHALPGRALRSLA